MSDPMQQEMTEEEIRAYLEQVREADPAVMVVQAYRMLGEGAELKLGRSDARVLIDAMAAVIEAVADRLAGDIVAQMREGVRQLQATQVEAEQQAGEQGEGAADAGQPGSRPPSGPAPGAPPQGAPQQGGQQEENLTNRLWIPGREPGR
jgi:hypothetical protein